MSGKFWPKSSENLTNLAKFGKIWQDVQRYFNKKLSFENGGFWDSIPKQCKGVQCVDLGESFPTHIFLQILALIQPITSI
jgi:hypothetical protein